MRKIQLTKALLIILTTLIAPTLISAHSAQNITPDVTRVKDKKGITEKQIAIIYAILKNTHEVRIHQQNGARENVVYVSKDGHSEVVFGKDGKRVQDGINDGSYNYYHPSLQPLLHFTYDISPWIQWGTSRQDTTTITSRIQAYMGDLEGGILRALKQQKIFRIKPSQKGQYVALAIFLQVIEQGKAEKLFQLFTPQKEITDEEFVDILQRIYQGFQKVYGSN